jgi:small subunit ribosomal protein S21
VLNQKGKSKSMAFENSLTGSTVYVRNDNVEQALRKFKKKIQDSGLLQEVRDRGEYVKPTIVRKKKAAAAKQRWKRKLQSQRLPEKLY